MLPIVTASQMCNERGRINIFGINTTTLIAGHLEVCDGTYWRAVYDRLWDSPDVRLVCQAMGFPPEGNFNHHFVLWSFYSKYTGAIACNNSCFGASSLERGFYDVICNNANTFIECGKSRIDGRFPRHNAGVICSECKFTDMS